jgi:hypothetical protein
VLAAGRGWPRATQRRWLSTAMGRHGLPPRSRTRTSGQGASPSSRSRHGKARIHRGRRGAGSRRAPARRTRPSRSPAPSQKDQHETGKGERGPRPRASGSLRFPVRVIVPSVGVAFHAPGQHDRRRPATVASRCSCAAGLRVAPRFVAKEHRRNARPTSPFVARGASAAPGGRRPGITSVPPPRGGLTHASSGSGAARQLGADRTGSGPIATAPPACSVRLPATMVSVSEDRLYAAGVGR